MQTRRGLSQGHVQQGGFLTISFVWFRPFFVRPILTKRAFFVLMALSEGIESERILTKRMDTIWSPRQKHPSLHSFTHISWWESWDFLPLSGAYVSSSPLAFSTSWLGRVGKKWEEGHCCFLSITFLLKEFYRSIKTN